jgi:hypothetical protein
VGGPVTVLATAPGWGVAQLIGDAVFALVLLLMVVPGMRRAYAQR